MPSRFFPPSSLFISLVPLHIPEYFIFFVDPERQSERAADIRMSHPSNDQMLFLFLYEFISS